MNKAEEGCKWCNSEEIIYWEYLGTYDGILTYKCDDCKKITHYKTGFEVLKEIQGEKYGPMYFILKGPDKIPLRYINQFPYDRYTMEEDKIFEDLENNLLL